MRNLTKGNPLKVILLFAIPIYVGQQFQLLYSIVDTRIIGSVLGDESLAAVGATASFSDMLIEFLNGIICGFGIIIAAFFGADDSAYGCCRCGDRNRIFSGNLSMYLFCIHEKEIQGDDAS